MGAGQRASVGATDRADRTVFPPARLLLYPLVAIAFAAACTGDSDTPSPMPGSPLPNDRVTFYGADPGDHAGPITSGDFNGDGETDIAMGAISADGPANDREDAGEVYLFFGPFQPGSSLDAAEAGYDVVLYGAAPGDNFGRALAAGDFNNDGAADLAIGAPAARSAAGAVYVMFGGGWAPEVDFQTDEADILFSGGDPGDFAGFMLATSDFDGDEAADLAITAILADGPDEDRAEAGEIYLLEEMRTLAGKQIDLSEVANVVYGARPGDRLGEALAAGDVNQDGRPDLVVVATFSAGPDSSRPGAGQTYVLESPLAFPIDLASASAALTVVGADEGDQLGHSIGVSEAGEIWLGAVSADGLANEADLAGEAVLLADAGDSGAIDVRDGQAAAIIYGPEKVARLGRCLAVGDVSGDGSPDLLIAAPNVDERAGRIFVFYGPGPYPEDASGADVALAGRDPGDVLGHESFGTPCISTADVDGDGRRDLLIAAPQGDGPENGRADAGEAYLVTGTAFGG